MNLNKKIEKISKKKISKRNCRNKKMKMKVK